MWYCILSVRDPPRAHPFYLASPYHFCAQATSKVYLGWILYINVLAKASFNDAVSLAGDNYTSINVTEWC